MNNPLRNLPSVNELLESPVLKALVNRVSHNVVVNRARSLLDDLRHEIQARAEIRVPSVAELAERIASRVLAADEPALRPVINATGILLHTGLGRAPLAEAAVSALAEAAANYASVELDLPSGERSQRVAAVRSLWQELTGAEAVAVVNNCAGATLITLAALAQGREVIVSRGQLIEIGGSFRLPEVMAASGAVLREVGTTNKTRLADYEQAICDRTAALLLVHPSNYVVAGFTESVELRPLVELGRKHRLPVIHDVGSGALIDLAQFGLHGEPLPAQSLRHGADLVLFSGDKLLGGPQCGVILGRAALVGQIAKHPLARALRVDKLTLAALAATLRLYRDPAVACRSIPLLQLLSTPLQNLQLRAERLAAQIAAMPTVASAQAVQDTAYLGGGSVPTQQLATWCVAIEPQDGGVDRLAARLRTGTPAIVGRIRDGRLLLDLRSVFPRQDQELVNALERLHPSPQRQPTPDSNPPSA
ncbi:MAG: L-seryl-tRNA(Sec) selenium transferase [Pirellulales bacterium]|nr:L-seryl-tRNA(Sec) selenium transferase [Pirellulales bacterium]